MTNDFFCDRISFTKQNKATIVNIDDSNYKVIVTDANGVNTGHREIENTDISKIVFSKKQV